MIKMQAGKLDRKITVLKRTASSDAKGGLNEGFDVLVSDLPASHEPMTARDVLRGGAVGADFDVVFHVRYRTDISESDRIRFDGKVFDIQSAQEAVKYGRRRWLEIRARVIQ
jgi:SPP1 family predicted phage head-tail adaptor